MPRRSSLLVALALTVLAVAADATETPSGEELLDVVLSVPAVPYQGRVMVTQWYGKQNRAEEMRVFFRPPDNMRREFLEPDGSVSRISVSDGDVEKVRLVRSGKTLIGDAVRSYEKVLAPQKEREVLLANYELISSTGEKVAGRPTWDLTLKPRGTGKSWETFRLDRETGVVLRSKRFMPRRAFANEAQFTIFEPGKATDESFFQLEATTHAVIASPTLAPDFMTQEQLRQLTGTQARIPDRLQGGFIFESADTFRVGKRRVTHVRYTDGLTIVSLFLTDRPVRLPKGGVISKGSTPLPGTLRASRAGKVLHWRAGARHYTLVGDVSRELLGDIAKALH